MISLADLLFLAGLAVVVGGCWYTGIGLGVAACGGVVCLGALVLRRVQWARKRRRR